MMYRRALKWHISILFILIFLFACDLGSLLYTEREIEALFSFSFEQFGEQMTDGSQAVLESPLELKWTKDDGAPEPVRFEVVLLSANRAEFGRLAFIKGKTDETLPGKDEKTEEPGSSVAIPEKRSFSSGEYIEIHMEKFENLSFHLPEDLPKGYYEIVLTALSARAEKLSSKKIVLLVGVSQLDEIMISSLPAEQGPGERSMFRLDYGDHDDLVPWIRWSVDGKEHAYGPASEHADRFLWKAPDEEGVHIVQAEFYPFLPPESLAKPVFISAEIKVPVSARKSRAKQEWEPVINTVINAPFANLEEGSSIIGKIYPEAMGNSYGMVMGQGSGISLDYNILEDIGEEAAFFTFDIAPGLDGHSRDFVEGEYGSGALLQLVNGSIVILEAGLNQGRPYIKNTMSHVELLEAIPMRAGRLVISFDYNDDLLETGWYFSSSRLGNMGIEASQNELKMARRTVIAGIDGLYAIYGRLGLGEGPWPWLELDARAKYGERLLDIKDFSRQPREIAQDESFIIYETPEKPAEWYELVLGISSGNGFLALNDNADMDIAVSPGRQILRIPGDSLDEEAGLALFPIEDEVLTIDYIILSFDNSVKKNIQSDE